VIRLLKGDLMTLRSIKDIIEELGIPVISLDECMPNKEAYNHPEPETDLEFLQKPITWPALPFAPMVKRGDKQEIGLVYSKTPGVVYFTNLFSLPLNGWQTVLEESKKYDYGSWEALLAAGWECD
jgi:hypothetical protein